MRKLNVSIWVCIICVCDTMVVSEWLESGCGFGSVVAAVAFYTVAGIAIWCCMDDIIKRKTNKNN